MLVKIFFACKFNIPCGCVCMCVSVSVRLSRAPLSLEWVIFAFHKGACARYYQNKHFKSKYYGCVLFLAIFFVCTILELARQVGFPFYMLLQASNWLRCVFGWSHSSKSVCFLYLKTLAKEEKHCWCVWVCVCLSL